MEENDGAQAQEGVADVKTRISVQERLKDLRVEKGLKLEELAEQVGLSKSALGSYENDEDKEINHGSLLKLADFYQVTVDYLLGLSDNRAHENTPLAELHLTDEAVALLKSGEQLPISRAHLPQVKEQMKAAGKDPVLLVPPQLRPLLARYARLFAPGLHVLSYNEVPDELELKIMGALS